MTATTITVVRDTNVPYTTPGERTDKVFFTWTIGASPLTYTAGGIAASFAGLVNHSSQPIVVRVWDEDVAQVYWLKYIPGTTQANGKIAIYTTAGTVLAEISGAIPAALSDSTALRMSATFFKGK